MDAAKRAGFETSVFGHPLSEKERYALLAGAGGNPIQGVLGNAAENYAKGLGLGLDKQQLAIFAVAVGGITAKGRALPKEAEKVFAGRELITENLTSKRVLIQSVPKGTEAMAMKDFEAMAASNVKVINTPKGGIRMGTLSDGSVVKLRPSNDGGFHRRTIEIIGANGNTIKEVRYGDKIK